MISILDLCSGKWEQEMGGDSEWEAVCTGWRPEVQQRAVNYPAMAVRMTGTEVTTLPPDLLGCDLDEFLGRMQNA